MHLRPPRSEQGRLLLTVHPENGCQTWTRTKTSGLTGRRATLTPPGNGAADRIPTCIVPFRRRMPHMFDHGSNLKLVSAAGLAPAVTRSQAEHVAATLRAVAPANGWRRGLGSVGMETAFLGTHTPSEIWRTRRDLHPQPSRRQRVAPLIELRIQKWWEVLVTLQFVASDRYFVTPDLQSSSRITSRKIGSGGRNHTSLTKFMRLRSVL